MDSPLADVSHLLLNRLQLSKLWIVTRPVSAARTVISMRSSTRHVTLIGFRIRALSAWLIQIKTKYFVCHWHCVRVYNTIYVAVILRSDCNGFRCAPRDNVPRATKRALSHLVLITYFEFGYFAKLFNWHIFVYNCFRSVFGWAFGR